MATYEAHQWVVPDQVMIYKRPRSSMYQMRMLRPDGGYIVKSTKKKNVPDAIQAALAAYGEMTYKVERNLPITDYTFKDLYDAWWDKEKSSKSIHRVRYIEGTVRRYLLPYFKDHLKNIKISALTDSHFDDYFTWRKSYWTSGIGVQNITTAKARRNNSGRQRHSKLGNIQKDPAYKSLLMEQSLIKQIFHWAHRRDMLNSMPYVKAPRPHDWKNKEKSRRPTFQPEEWMTLVRYMREWVKDNTYQKQPKRNHRWISDQKSMPNRVHKLHRFQREMCRHYYLFMAQTGLRPNEARQMLWKDLRYNDQLDLHYIQVRETTKTGERPVYGHQNWVDTLKRLRSITPFNKDDDYVFTNTQGKPHTDFGKTFKSLLIELDLLKDDYGRDRTIYSLRHYFANQRLLNGEMTMEDLADTMGTSIIQIYKHYRHANIHKDAKRHAYARPIKNKDVTIE